MESDEQTLVDLERRLAALEKAQKPKTRTFAGLAVLTFLLIIISWAARGVIERKAPTTHEVIFAIAGIVLLYTDPHKAANLAYKRLNQ